MALGEIIRLVLPLPDAWPGEPRGVVVPFEGENALDFFISRSLRSLSLSLDLFFPLTCSLSFPFSRESR